MDIYHIYHHKTWTLEQYCTKKGFLLKEKQNPDSSLYTCFLCLPINLFRHKKTRRCLAFVWMQPPGHVGATMTLDLGHVVQSAHGEAIKLTTQGLVLWDEKR